MAKILIAAVLLAVSSYASADWHHGKITMIAIGYDGKTVSIQQEGFTRTNCTCYPSWPNRYCLNRERESYYEEYALLLAAKDKEKSVSIHINEESCKIEAIYEM